MTTSRVTPHLLEIALPGKPAAVVADPALLIETDQRRQTEFHGLAFGLRPGGGHGLGQQLVVDHP